MADVGALPVPGPGLARVDHGASVFGEADCTDCTDVHRCAQQRTEWEETFTARFEARPVFSGPGPAQARAWIARLSHVFACESKAEGGSLHLPMYQVGTPRLSEGNQCWRLYAHIGDVLIDRGARCKSCSDDPDRRCRQYGTLFRL